MTHTPAYHIIDGKRIIMPAHSITLYPPYSSMEYGSLENEIFCDDWLRFYTDEPFICNSSVPLGTPFKAMDHSYISSLIHLIAVENFFQNQYKNFTVQSLFQILFSKLKESLSYNNSSTFHEMALQQLHINIASNPSSPWNIPDMAKQLHISTRHLQKLYQKKFGTSCMEDVMNTASCWLRKSWPQQHYQYTKLQNNAAIQTSNISVGNLKENSPHRQKHIVNQ